ncbi:hypothetical protein K6119_18095 [Paracrocinitomix mangrovi]|uniref:hypothetical protein n=1 Tax=Paracrocinitomix mangrovi TaxID=2862509 RepID=UPI001C8F0753|nr:hypothetical protein [Paracrocinitomix mangrovi]UKN01637.1 hypothetical protein K6119_18095 [Paracrocinitomix mangrovi]
MKRKIFSALAIAAIAFTSCKKDDLDTTELGEATIEGNIWADLDQSAMGVEGVSGMQVKIEVNTQNWDQQPVGGYNYDKKVYTATTDANGDYSFTLPATDDGYNVTLEFEDLYTTRTLVDGTTETVRVTRGNITKFIYSGAAITTVDEGTINQWNTTTYGSATVKGTVYIQPDYAFWNLQDNPVPFTNAVASTYGLPTVQILWKYDTNDEPYNITDQVVRYVDFDMNTGQYTLTIPTEAPDMNDVYINWGINDFEGNGLINNNAGTADSTVAGYYDNSQIWSNGDWLWDGYILNQDFTMYFNQY